MIPDIIELNFPKKDGKQYATLTQATANIADMGEKTITTQVKIDGEIVPDFSRDWEVEFQGEKYIMPLRIPQGAKENTSLKSTIDLTFQHWAIYQLKRWPFVTIQQIAAGTYLPDEEVATVQLNLKDFCILFGQVLEYYYGGAITIDLNPAWQYKHEAIIITISHTKIWNVLIDAFHDKYGVRWEIKAASGNSNTVKGGERYVIRVGYPTTEVDHIFEYGFEGGLLKVERQVQSEEIRNILKGRGGETNIPFRYFKNTDPNNPSFRPDPDWVEELANIPFTNLMSATFRSYVQGWKAAHISKYPGYTAVGIDNAYSPWAYQKGLTDTKFQPVEFVADEIIINSSSTDRHVEILPGYSPAVLSGSSLDKYGPLTDTLDNNDEIYPTIQGTGLDIAVAVEQIKSDDIEASVESDAKPRKIPACEALSGPMEANTRKTVILESSPFTVEAGYTADLIDNTYISRTIPYRGSGYRFSRDEPYSIILIGSPVVKVFNAVTGAERSASAIPSGEWRYRVEATVENASAGPYAVLLKTNPELKYAALQEDKWTGTFDIWVKNIWATTKLSTENDIEYAERVWKPILGDREGNEAAVMFTSGNLVHEDYEFKIPKGSWPVYDTSKTWEEKDSDGNVVATHTSHWRIRLAKSDAELEATGLYVPSTKKQGAAGDRFVFIGTELVHYPYVVDAEIRLDDNKKDHLGEVKEIKPTFVVTTDRIRFNQKDIYDPERLAFIIREAQGRILSQSGNGIVLEHSGYTSLFDILRPGNTIRLADKRFIQPMGDRAYETLYLQSITYTYREPTSDDAALNPDVEIVLGNEYTTSANPVSTMQGEISALQQQIGSISNIEQVVRAVGDRLYLRKDGISDRSLSPTQFYSLLTNGSFRAGLVGGAGWGFFQDENGNWVLETDRVNVRQDMTVNSLVINQVEGRGGMQVDTAAYMQATQIVETDSGYICYFDQKSGSVANLFHVGDVAYCNRWNPDTTALKFYKRRVTAITENSITLTKALDTSERPAGWPDSGVNGTGVPEEGDNIIHFGSYTDATRQYVKVRDVVGGGYERYIDSLDSVNATGTEYYFVGRQSGMYNGRPRFYIGDDNGYVEWVNGELNVKARINALSTFTDESGNESSIGQYITDTANELMAVEYSATGADGTWHSTYTNGDRYMRQSSDGGNTWSGAMLITAQDVTITNQSVEYATSASGTTAPTAGWSTTIPSVAEGQYLWTRTTVVYSDTTSTVSYSVSRQATNGTDGSSYTNNLLRNSNFAKGLEKWSYWGTNASGLREVVTEDGKAWAHIRNDIAVQGLQQGSLNMEIPAKPNTKYTLSGLVRSAVDGQKACANIHGISSDNKNVFASNTTIVATTSAQRFVKTFTTSAGVIAFRLMIGVDVADKNDVYFTDLKIEEGENAAPQWTPHPDEMLAPTFTQTVTYAITTTPAQPSDAAFIHTALPSVAPGEYLWSRTEISGSDGSSSVAYAVSRTGTDGDDGLPGAPGADGKTQYTHIAYAKGATGALPHPTAFTKFQTTAFDGAEYIGFRHDFDQLDPSDHTLYEWSKYKGKDGNNFLYNLIRGANQPLGKGNTNYDIGGYYYDAELEVGKTYTLTVCYHIKDADAGQFFGAWWNSGVNVFIANLFGGATIVSKTITFPAKSATSSGFKGVSFYKNMPSGATREPDNYIEWATLTEGETPQTQWIPALSEMTQRKFINNLLRNSDFSEGTKHWTFTNSSCAKIDTTELLDGRCSLKIDTTNSPGGYPGAKQRVVYEGASAEFTASVYTMMKDVSQRAGHVLFEVHFLNEAGARISAYQRFVNPKSDEQWEKYVFHFTSPSGTKMIEVFCWSQDGQTVWYNGMKLEFGNNDNPQWTPNADGLAGAGIVANVIRDNLTEAQWNVYGTIGHAEPWRGTDNGRNGCRTGDLFTVSGRATDTGNGHLLTYRSTSDYGVLAGTCISHIITNAGKDAPYTVFQWAKGDYAQPTGAWSDTPLNALPGEFVWMRSGTVTPPATAPTSWGTPIRLTGDTGKAGGDALLLDLDNEVVAVTCDADGNVISGLPATINARVFKGGTEVTSGVTYGNEATTLTMSQSGKVYTISGISKDRDTLTIKATVGGVTLKSTVNVYKVKAGADGAPATMYFLEPAESSVTRTAQGGLSVASLGCRKLYVTGSDQRHLTTANTLTAQIYTNGVAGTETVIAADGASNNGVVTLTDDTTAVVFTLYKGASTAEGDLLDRERVPVLTDAFGLSVGGVNLLRKTNSGIINWTTNTSSNGQIVMEPGTPQSRCVFYNNATTAAPDWQMIGFALPADTIKANCYYMLSFKARVLQSNGTAGGASTQPLQLRWQISKSTGGDRLTNVESRTVTYTETRFTIMMRTTGVPTSQHRLWGYISTTGTAWEALEIWDMQLEEGVVATEYKASPLDFNYLTEALKEETTTVEGGVILSSLMRLGYTASDAYRVTAGMNGVLAPSTDGTDPAIWAGGDMLDATSDENSSADLDSLAKLMFRHNGNGYMCGGVVRVLDGRILIGRNRKADGTIKSDAEFAQDCIILDEEGLTYVSGGQDRLLVTSAQVGDTFETKVNAVNWSGTATAFNSIALAHYYSKEMILEPVKPEQTASEDGTEALSTTYLETWSWVPTMNIAQTKTINIGSGTIAVGTVIEVSSLSTSFSITRSHSEGVHITATAELCYTDSAGKVQVVRKVNMPKQYSGNTCSFSMGTTIRHTVQVAASYFVRLTLTPNTVGVGKPLANENKTVTPATATASGAIKTTRSDVTIIGTDGIKSIWGDGGFLANSNGVKIRGSLWINGKLVTTS